MQIDYKITKELIKAILENADAYQWSLQGLGMLRLHLGNNLRVHVWDTMFAFPGASPIHDHLQWGLDSYVLAGEICNIRFTECEPGEGKRYLHTTIKAGYGAYFKHEPREIWLKEGNPEFITAGEMYSQRPDEIHWSRPVAGTVTIMQKKPNESDSDSARIFWDYGTEWGSAEPRQAYADEVKAITQVALKRWF